MVALKKRLPADASVFDLTEEVQAVIDEILTYKWLESEKCGYDIGLRRATSEWISKHYDDWFRYNHEKFEKKASA